MPVDLIEGRCGFVFHVRVLSNGQVILVTLNTLHVFVDALGDLVAQVALK